MTTATFAPTALVLGGGAARGAYEAGVTEYCFGQVARDLGRALSIPIRCGTSVGAVNSCLLAARAGEADGGSARLVGEWTSLSAGTILRPDLWEALGMARGVVTTPRAHLLGHRLKGGLLDPRGLDALVRRGIDFAAIGAHLRSGRLQAVTISTTHVGSGRTVVFVDRHEPGLPAWRVDPGVQARRATLGADHVMASAAIPVLFPPHAIDGEPYCDGGLRQYVPLSPAHRLGARGILVVSPHSAGETTTSLTAAREQSVASPLYLVGKTLDALLGDRLDADVDRLRMVNLLLDAGRRRFGRGFLDAVNHEMGLDGEPGLRPLQLVVVQASERLGAMAAAFVRTRLFATRVRGALGRALRHLADADPDGDLLSYVLFDGEFAARLVELGRADARRHHDELCALFATAGAAPAIEGVRRTARRGSRRIAPRRPRDRAE